MLSRRGLITGAAALAAYSQMEDAEAVNRLLLLGGVPHLPGSAVDMNFAAGQYYGGSLSSLISVSRASQKTNLLSTSASGYPYLTFANNTAAITPGFGILIEQASSNIFLNSSAPVTQSISLAATGSYTLWVNGSGSAAISAGSATITGAGTATNGSPVTINCTATGTVTVTISGSLNVVQLEPSSFPTSYIPTTSSTVARAADVVSIIGAGASSIAFPFSTYFNVGPLPLGNNSNSIGFNSTFSGISNVNGSSNVLGAFNGSTQLSVNLGSGLWSTGVQHAESFTSNSQAICGNAGSVGSLAQSIGTLIPSQYRLGGYGSGNQINGYMRRFAIFNYAVSNNALQALT